MLKIIATPDQTFLASGRYGLLVSIQEDDLLLGDRLVSGEISWGDGSVVAIDLQAIQVGELATAPVLYTHDFLPGMHVVRVIAKNYRAPVADVDLFVDYVNLTRAAAPAAPGGNLTIGPIMSRDVGYPNASQWKFDVGRDLQTVESAVKLLLTTARGERLMNPDYGTNLGRIIFDSDDAAIDGLVQHEISQAVERHAGGIVTIQSISVNRGGPRRINVEVKFISRAKRQPFQVNMKFER
jgi:phage baseplate assembly protein W